MDIVGGVAAVAQIGVYVVKTVFHLKNLLKDVEEVPERITQLVKDLETYEPILSGIGDQLSRYTHEGSTWDASLVSLPYQRCRNAFDELLEMILDIKGKFDNAKSKTGKMKLRGRVLSFKVVLKKDDIKRLKSRLSSAKEALALTIQLCIL
jgi:hypothetical protein